MITIENLLPKGLLIEDLSLEHQRNLWDLLPRLQAIEAASEIPFICSSGYRTLEHHLAIYAHLNVARAEQNLPLLKVPMNSKHLSAQAADILDPERRLGAWVEAHEDFCRLKGLCCEELRACEIPVPWVHFQSVAVSSGKFFFDP